MFWVTYRQFRATLLGTLAVIVVIAAATIAASLALRSYPTFYSFGTLFFCYGGGTAECMSQTVLTATTLMTVALPVLIGLFVGVAVFSRDIERGTHVLSLTQSVSPLRWYFSRVLVVFAPIVLAMAVLGVTFTWMRSLHKTGPCQTAGGIDASRFDYPIFETSGLMPGAYTAAALMIGSLLALLLRNTIGAMVVTLIVAVGLLVALPTAVRQHYAAPSVETKQLSAVSGPAEYMSFRESNRWTIDQNYVDADGNVVDIDYRLCAPADSFWDEMTQRSDETYGDWLIRSDKLQARSDLERTECIAAQGADRFELEYHEDSQFWRFQITEVVLALIVAALACAASVAVVRGRLRRT